MYVQCFLLQRIVVPMLCAKMFWRHALYCYYIIKVLYFFIILYFIQPLVFSHYRLLIEWPPLSLPPSAFAAPPTVSYVWQNMIMTNSFFFLTLILSCFVLTDQKATVAVFGKNSLGQSAVKVKRSIVIKVWRSHRRDCHTNRAWSAVNGPTLFSF